MALFSILPRMMGIQEELNKCSVNRTTTLTFQKGWGHGSSGRAPA
jgi:hypothetical protein